MESSFLVYHVINVVDRIQVDVVCRTGFEALSKRKGRACGEMAVLATDSCPPLPISACALSYIMVEEMTRTSYPATYIATPSGGPASPNSQTDALLAFGQ